MFVAGIRQPNPTQLPTHSHDQDSFSPGCLGIDGMVTYQAGVRHGIGMHGELLLYFVQGGLGNAGELNLGRSADSSGS